MVGSVQEIYERYLRTAERRYPMVVILTGDGNDTSQRITDRNVNALLNGLTKTGVRVNAVLLTSSGVGLVRSIVLEMIKRTGGAHESVIIATALSGRMKVMAGRVAQQYKQVSPDKAPADEFRGSAPRK
jgi:flavorubredoxin